ncbi:MAG: YHYH protein, partial [Pseudomonadota bacterium]
RYLLEIPYLEARLGGDAVPFKISLTGEADLSSFSVNLDSLELLDMTMQGNEIVTLTQSGDSFILDIPRLTLSLGPIMQDYSVRFQSSDLLTFEPIVESVSTIDSMDMTDDGMDGGMTDDMGNTGTMDDTMMPDDMMDSGMTDDMGNTGTMDDTMMPDDTMDSGMNGDNTDDGMPNNDMPDSNLMPANILSVWLFNTTETSNTIADAVVNVQSAAQETVNGQEFARVQSSGVPNYLVMITQAVFDALANRPKAATDFASGAPTVAVGNQVAFGQDVGYSSNGCALGYWPPGPGCPSDASHNSLIPLNPVEGDDNCMSGLGATGHAINGVAIFNWWDGMSFNNENVWHVNAPVAEVLDVDICGGHAANGEYHHHAWNACWAEIAGEDEATGHSPVYGYAADGYPVYGPWHDKGDNIHAKSCWKRRDYSNIALGGCSDGQRSCILNDPTDLSQGTTATNMPGPNIGVDFTTLSSNVIPANSGLFYEDYYYDSNCSTTGEEYLDVHNGHAHDGLGFHYHLTLENNGQTVAFPYSFGPFYRGTLPAGGLAMCGSLDAGPGGMGPPPGGMGPPPGGMTPPPPGG